MRLRSDTTFSTGRLLLMALSATRSSGGHSHGSQPAARVARPALMSGVRLAARPAYRSAQAHVEATGGRIPASLRSPRIERSPQLIRLGQNAYPTRPDQQPYDD